MAENLAYLSVVYLPSDQANSISYYYVSNYFGIDINEAEFSNNYQTYGVLYNWTAAMIGKSSSNSNPSGVQGVWSSGWHLPSNSEWKELKMHLVMSQSEIDGTFWRGTDEGGKLKGTGTSYWQSPNTEANNNTGFTALLGGYCYNGGFSFRTQKSCFWTSTQDINNSDAVIGRKMSYTEQRIYYNSFLKQVGYSVRCVKD